MHAKLRLLGLGMVIATLMALTACGGSPAEATEGGGDRTVADSTRKNEPAPPKDYVRSRCGECGCRVFSGKTGYCGRPSCKHHWKKHPSRIG